MNTKDKSTSILTSEELSLLRSLTSYATEQEAELMLWALTGQGGAPWKMQAGIGLGSNLARYCPHRPFPRQAEFLSLQDEREVLYGGAAGGGKSDAILMAALQYVHDPSYSALILRRSYSDLSLPGAIMDRGLEWWSTLAKWRDVDKTFSFPSGATITFGYLSHEVDKYRYLGSEFNFIGFDELTQFTETQYTYLFSRLRRSKDSPVPSRMRAASNPGGIGHNWVKRRFVSKQAASDMLTGHYAMRYEHDGRIFVPSRLEDNIHADGTDYDKSLMELDPVTREQLRSGDWNASAEGRIKRHWLRYYRLGAGRLYILDNKGDVIRDISTESAYRFHTVDCAGTSEEVARQSRGKPHSLSAISTWDWIDDHDYLIWLDCVTGRWEFPELLKQIEGTWKKHNVGGIGGKIGIEDASAGRQAIQSLSHLPVCALSHQGKDKLSRAATSINAIECGRLLLPWIAPWREEVESKLLSWTGHPDEPADEIDTMAYAGIMTFGDATRGD